MVKKPPNIGWVEDDDLEKDWHGESGNDDKPKKSFLSYDDYIDNPDIPHPLEFPSEVSVEKTEYEIAELCSDEIKNKKVNLYNPNRDIIFLKYIKRIYLQ